VDATAIKAGRQVVHLAPTQLGLPDGFTVHEIAPDSASFTAHRTSPHELPVQAALIGRPPADLVVREVRVEPSRIRVMVDSSERGALMALQTEPINLADLRGDLTLTRGVILPRGSRLARGEPNSVQVTLTVEAAPH
jgi:hypothetical protein